jgi:competence protein ComEC
LKAWVLLISGAVSPYLFTSTLPSRLAALLFLAAIVLIVLKPVFRVACLFPVFFLLTTLAVNYRLATRLPAAANMSNHEISGRIGSLPKSGNDSIRFEFLPDIVTGSIPARIRVNWYTRKDKGGEVKAPEVHAGERWRLQLELRTTRRSVNFSGNDAERWLFAGGIGALAYVQAGENVRLAAPGAFDLQHWRASTLHRLEQVAGDVPAFRMLAALAIADRRSLLASDRDIFSATGTGHLLAISGLHIGLAAVMGFYLGRLALLLCPYGLRLRIAIVLPWCTSWLAALSYSALAGFGVSTQRALIMLSVATLVMLSRRKVHPGLAWMIAMSAVLLADPFAPLRAGFWFSFVAVAVLLFIFVPRSGAIPAWRNMIFAQLGISLVMAPLGMYWFQQASMPGLLANLVAIPVVSFLVVPLILAALSFLWLPGPVAAWLLSLAGHTMQWLFLFLEQLSVLQPAWLNTTRVPGLASTLLAMLGALIILMPRGIPGRYTGLLLMLPMLLPVAIPLAPSESQTDFLDVGQGLSVLVGTRNYLLVYDTGPGNGLVGEAGWDMVSGTIQPMIAARGQSPDLIVASHADLDHAGGLDRLQNIYPQAQYLASLPDKHTGIQQCRAPAAWSAGGMQFKILHPSAGLPYLGNDSSCVISVRGQGLNFLLSGDISHLVERRLVNEGLANHSIMSVPHHGSSTSSSRVLIEAVNPALALISAAADNRFDFPRADVIRRYQKAQVRIVNTADCGGIRITTDTHGTFRIKSARVNRKAIWRWPAGEDCP